MRPGCVYRFSFHPQVDLDSVQESLLLAHLGAESLHGEEQVRLDAAHTFDAALRQCVISAESDVGRDVARLFTGYLRREFPSDQFSIQRIRPSLSASQPEQGRV